VLAGDPFSGALTRAAGEAVGSYAILQGTLTLGPNYNLSYTGASLTIGAWTATGFYQPVDMPTGGMILNSIKGGQTVPLKFEIFAGAVEKTDVSAVQSFALAEVSCPSSSTVDDIELTSTGGTVLRYDGPAGQFIQNWQTPKTAGKCYKVTMTAADAVSKLIAYFKTK
jgi:MBG domain (YGX type)